MALNAWDEYQDPYPIWGTCLGFELLALLAVNGTRNLAACWSQDQALPLNLTDQWFTSRIGQAMPEDMTQLVASKPLTINFHRWCLTPQNFSKFHMEDFWQMLATGHDLDGVGKRKMHFTVLITKLKRNMVFEKHRNSLILQHFLSVQQRCTRQVNFNRTRIGEKTNLKNSNETFWVIFKHHKCCKMVLLGLFSNIVEGADFAYMKLVAKMMSVHLMK